MFQNYCILNFTFRVIKHFCKIFLSTYPHSSTSHSSWQMPLIVPECIKTQIISRGKIALPTWLRPCEAFSDGHGIVKVHISLSSSVLPHYKKLLIKRKVSIINSRKRAYYRGYYINNQFLKHAQGYMPAWHTSDSDSQTYLIRPLYIK